MSVVIFGGTGFIGTHLCQHLLSHGLAGLITLVDVRPPRTASYAREMARGIADGRVRYLAHDVRRPIPAALLEKADLIVDLAAVHREPGHAPEEYFETNIAGAENISMFASAVGCRRIVFASSISTYGPTVQPKTELSLTAPTSPYGSSKLAAEKVYQGWQRSVQGSRLLILRPGVVFGPGENGNVTRLIRSVVRGYFFYTGNRDVRKAGGYVKELCAVIMFGLQYQEQSREQVTVFNFSMDPPHSLEEFVDAINTVAGTPGTVFSVPRWALLAASHPIAVTSRLLGVQQPINPVRIRKLFSSTNIEPARLRQLGYRYQFTLVTALRDWKSDVPSDFERSA